jgi:hypothetical protein
LGLEFGVFLSEVFVLSLEFARFKVSGSQLRNGGLSFVIQALDGRFLDLSLSVCNVKLILQAKVGCFQLCK